MKLDILEMERLCKTEYDKDLSHFTNMILQELQKRGFTPELYEEQRSQHLAFSKKVYL